MLKIPPLNTKIMKGESIKPNLFELYTKPHPICYKDSKNINKEMRDERIKYKY